MQIEDTKETKISCQDINDALAEATQLRLYTVYIKGTATQVSQMLRQEGRIFNGTVKTSKWLRAGTVDVC